MFEISEVGAPATRVGKLPAILPKITAGALAFTVLPMIYLHLVSIGRLDPLRTTVSDYVSVPGGGAFLALSTIALALATALLPAQLGLAGRPVPAVAKIGLVLGCVGLFASVVFPTNALGTAVDEATVLHRYAAGLFFIAIPIVAAALARAGFGRGLRVCAVFSTLVGIAFLISHVPLVFPDFPHADLIGTLFPRGLIERILLLVDIATIAVISNTARPVAPAAPAADAPAAAADRLVRS
ncbi:MAG TPA: DUF998 domain-containing protein [Pseudonocardiaceae bacterium]|nr:DUF998 domain-containing protein [Pseudonocardiaceae bacterium]